MANPGSPFAALIVDRICRPQTNRDRSFPSLEAVGYVIRSDLPEQGGARIVRLTKRGRAAYTKIHEILRDIEHEWSAELGPKHFAQLKELLLRVWESPVIR